MTTKRAILSVSQSEANEIFTTLKDITKMYDNDGIALAEVQLTQLVEWRDRFHAISTILDGTVPIHFTDLGTEP